MQDKKIRQLLLGRCFKNTISTAGLIRDGKYICGEIGGRYLEFRFDDGLINYLFDRIDNLRKDLRNMSDEVELLKNKKGKK